MQRGFIALITVIIISCVLLVLVAASDLAAYYVRSDEVEAQGHMSALEAARGCAQIALLKLAQNYSYAPTLESSYEMGKGLPESVGSATCYIKTVTQLQATANAEVVEVDTWAQVQSSFASVRMSVEVPQIGAPSITATVEQ